MSLSSKEPWEFEQYSWMNKFIDKLNLSPLKSGTDEVIKTKLKKFLYDNDLTNSEVLKCYELKVVYRLCLIKLTEYTYYYCIVVLEIFKTNFTFRSSIEFNWYNKL